MNCPYCGTENSADAKECSNCSADLASLPKGTPPPETTAPTMMSSAKEVAAMLAASKAETSSEAGSETPVEEVPADSTAEETAAPLPDYASPTMVSSASEVAAMLAAAKAGEEEPMAEESSGEESSADVSSAEIPSEESTEEFSSPFAPTVISPVPAEVAAAIAAKSVPREDEPPPMDFFEPVEMGTVPEEHAPDFTAPTLIGIPDPLGMVETEEAPAPKAEPDPKFNDTSTPFINEPDDISSPSTPFRPPVTSGSTPPPKDNTRIFIIGGCGCLALLCFCVVVSVLLLRMFSVPN